jgi:hypothetical protein
MLGCKHQFDVGSPKNAALEQECAANLTMSWDVINTCWTGAEGVQLMEESASRSDSSKSVYGYEGKACADMVCWCKAGEIGARAAAAASTAVNGIVVNGIRLCAKSPPPRVSLPSLVHPLRASSCVGQRHSLLDIRAVLRLQRQVSSRFDQDDLRRIHSQSPSCSLPPERGTFSVACLCCGCRNAITCQASQISASLLLGGGTLC